MAETKIIFKIAKESSLISLNSIIKLVTEILSDINIIQILINDQIKVQHFRLTKSCLGKDAKSDPTVVSAIEYFSKYPNFEIDEIIIESEFKTGNSQMPMYKYCVRFVRNSTQLYNSIEIFNRSHDNHELRQESIPNYNFEKLECTINFINENFKVTNDVEIQRSSLDPVLINNISVYNSQIRELQILLEKQIYQIGVSISEYNKYILEKEVELEKKFSLKTQAKESELNEKEITLKNKESELDLKDSKAARRQLFKEITSKIENNKSFKYSTDTNSKREEISKIINRIYLFSFTLLITSGIAFAYYDPSKTPNYFVEPKYLLSIATLFVSMITIYSIRWYSYWIKEHENMEYYNILYYNDVLRASWLAEMVMEWESEKEGKEFPKELYEAYTRNLFNQSAVKSNTVLHPMDELSKLLENVTKLKLGKGVMEVERTLLDQTDKQIKP